jgi:hypothetical protein
VSPSSGSGTAQSFSFVYSDQSGFADISYVDILFQTQISAQNACYTIYVPSSNTIALMSDAGNSYAGAATLGTAGTLSNSQCTLDTGASSASGSGTSLTLNAALTFKPAFNGTKNIYTVSGNGSNVSSGWQAKGSWIVPSAIPVNVSVSPASGSGTVQLFSFAYSDQSGFADISYVDFLFQAQFTGQNACYAIYSPSSKTITLMNDAGNSSAGSATLGTVGTLSNSQCTLDTGASSASGSGNSLTLNVKLTFKPSFAGTKNIFTVSGNGNNVSSGWQFEGSWTAQ